MNLKEERNLPNVLSVAMIPSYLWDTFRNAVRRATDLLNCIERTENQVHPDFDIIDDGWYWNQISQPVNDPTYKVCFYFNAENVDLLNNCPFPCKFAANTNTSKDFQYCGFAYPQNDQKLSTLEEWSKRFPLAELCTYGKHLFDGGWVSGKVAKVIIE
jgi:hypothetical protein